MTSDDPSAVLVGPAAEALRSQLQELQPQLLVRCFDDLYEAVASLRDERPRSFWIDEKRITGEDVGSLRLLRRLFPDARVMLVLSGRKSKLGDLAVELGFALVPSRPELRHLLTFLGPSGTGIDVAEDLVAGIADQLNNPLAALVGRLQLIGLTLPADLDADLADNLRLALDSARRLQSSIHKLTLLSRRRTPVPRRQPLGALVLARLTALAGKAVDIEIPERDPEVLADEDLCGTALDCLGRVALDLQPPGRPLEARVRAQEGLGVVELALAEPLPLPCRRDEVLEPYRLLRLFEDPDLGLDPAVARTLVEAQGGRLEPWTRSGFLAGFQLSLPLAGRAGQEPEDA